MLLLVLFLFRLLPDFEPPLQQVVDQVLHRLLWLQCLQLIHIDDGCRFRTLDLLLLIGQGDAADHL